MPNDDNATSIIWQLDLICYRHQRPCSNQQEISRFPAHATITQQELLLHKTE